jgi:hypothetical protein
VLDHRRDEQVKMANYIAEGVQLAAAHVGDGGMNPVFADQLTTQTEYDSKGQLVQVAVAPGALPHVPNPPGTTIPRAQVQPEQAQPEQPQSEPLVAQQSSQPQEKQQPISLAAVPRPASAPKQAATRTAAATVGLRGTNTDLAARPRVTTADPREVAKALAPSHRRPAEAQPAKSADSDIRTAYSAPAPAATSESSVIAGAQPTVPVGSFDSRWLGLR